MQTEKRQRKNPKGEKQPTLKSKNGTPAEKKLPGAGLLSILEKRKYRHMIGTEKKQEPR